MARVPAFQLDFDPTVLFTEASGDHDFDKILSELDLELATDTTTTVVQNILTPATASDPQSDGLTSTASDASGLRQLFGLQQMWGTQQPQQQLPSGLQQQQQQQQQLLLLLQQQQQQQQQQLAPSSAVVYQLPSPFMKPVSSLPPDVPLQGTGMYAGLHPATHVTMQQQGQLHQPKDARLSSSGGPQLSSPPAAPMFTFNALPAPSSMPASTTPMPPLLDTNPAAASAAAAGLYMLPGMWPALLQQPGGFNELAGGAAGNAPGAAAFNSYAPQAGLLPSGHEGLAAPVGRAGVQPKQGRGRVTTTTAAGAEKPKAPSQRFRERQKATISSLEAEVTQKLAQLQTLSAENEILKLRSAVLEAVTSGREYHMKVIREHGPPSFDVADSSQRNTLLRGSGSGKSHIDSDPNHHLSVYDSPRSGSISSCHTADVAAALTGSGSATMSADVAAAVAAAAANDTAAAADVPPSDPLMCGIQGACTVDVCKQSIRCIRQMTADDITMHWRQFLQDVSEQLLTADEQQEQQRLEAGQLGLSSCCTKAKSAAAAAAAAQQQQHDQEAESQDSETFTMTGVCRWCGCASTGGVHSVDGCFPTTVPAATATCTALSGAAAAHAGPATPARPAAGPCTDERLVELVHKYSYMTKFVALLNPGVLYSLLGRNLDTGESAAYTDDHWRSVVARLHLTNQQVAHILACAELYFSSLCQLMHERQALQQALKQAEGGLSDGQQLLLGVDCGLDQLTLLDQLSSNLKKEHVLRIMLNCFVWGRMLTAVQFAKTAVYSHPFFPDVHAMVCVLYEDQWKDSACTAQGKVFPHRIAAAKAALVQPFNANGGTAAAAAVTAAYA